MRERVEVFKTESTHFGVGYEIHLDGDVHVTVYGPNAGVRAFKEAERVRARIEHRPDPQ